MYGFIWRHLPGDFGTRIAVAVGLVAAVALILWYVAFPWVEPKINYDHGTVSGTSATAHRP
jgi:hypothetical protein